MKLIITGGAGFIGSRLVLHWLKKHPDDKIFNLDKLTYAANLQNLQSVEKNTNYQFIQIDLANLEYFHLFHILESFHF